MTEDKPAEDVVDVASAFRPARDTNDLVGTADAAVWAATFVKQFEGQTIGLEDTDSQVGLGTLVGWFANAMGAEESALRRRGKLYDSQIPMPDGWDPDRVFEDADDVTSLIYQLVGAGSVCWQFMQWTGIFQDQKAVAVAEAGIKRLHEIADVRAFTGEVANSAGGA